VEMLILWGDRGSSLPTLRVLRSRGAILMTTTRLREDPFRDYIFCFGASHYVSEYCSECCNTWRNPCPMTEFYDIREGEK
jgi:hypothetical protein